MGGGGRDFCTVHPLDLCSGDGNNDGDGESGNGDIMPREMMF